MGIYNDFDLDIKKTEANTVTAAANSLNSCKDSCQGSGCQGTNYLTCGTTCSSGCR